MRFRRPSPQSGSRAGFSLIEMMTVIVILLILMAFLIPRLTGLKETVEASATRVFLTGQLRAAIGEYENEFGDAPGSAWNEAWGAAPNTTNLGSEALFAALWSETLQGLGLDEERRANTDGDSAAKSPTALGGKELYELPDEWGNPIAYFHHANYGRSDVYLSYALETGEEEERTIQAQKDPETKAYYNPRGYQLISAGTDGIFGTEDDIANFGRRD